MSKIRKPIGLVLALLMLISVFAAVPLTAGAETSGDYVYSVLDDGTISITKYRGSDTEVVIPGEIDGHIVTRIEGSGDEDNWEIEKTNIFGYSRGRKVTKVTLPDSVTSIGECAFEDCRSLESITIPESVTSIGSSAFYDCSSLMYVSIPDSVKSIDNDAFRWCSSITSVTIGSGVTSIGDTVFSGCSSLTSFNVDADNEKYCSAEGILYNKDKTELILYPKGKSEESFTVLDSVTSIGSDAFSFCTSLKSITIPDSVTSIGSYSFFNCENLADINLGDNIRHLGSDAFSGTAYYNNDENWDGDGTRKTVLYVDKYLVTALGGYYRDQYTAGDYTIREGTIGICDYAFAYCKSLESVTIPDSVKYIGSCAFYSCTDLKSVDLSDNVVFIGKKAFGFYRESNEDRMNGAFNIIAKEGTVADIYRKYNGFISYRTTTIQSDDGYRYRLNSDGTACITGYEGSETELTIPAEIDGYKVESVDDGEGSFPSELTSVTISDGITRIGEDAFAYCKSLASVSLPDSVTSIGSGAFYGCSSLMYVSIPDREMSIGSYAFDNTACYNDENNWDDDVFYIDNHLIRAKETIEGDYAVKEGTVVIGDGAFRWCSSITSVTIPDSVKSIGNGAFASCSSLTSVTIGNGVTSIGDEAFAYCKSLESITIPDSVTSIGEEAFYYCSNLKIINIGKGVNTIGRSAFYNTAYSKDESNREDGAWYINDILYDASFAPSDFKIKEGTRVIMDIPNSAVSVTIPNTVTSIEDYAFAGCESLESVTIPTSVTSIGSNAFRFCTSLKSITIPDSVTSIASSAFYGCSSLMYVSIPDSVTSIGSSAFENCNNLQFVAIPDSVTSIGSSAFYGCSSLMYVSIPDREMSVGSSAFENCNNLQFVAIPDSVKFVGDRAFGYQSEYNSSTEKYTYSIIDGFKMYCNPNTPAYYYAYYYDIETDALINEPEAPVIPSSPSESEPTEPSSSDSQPSDPSSSETEPSSSSETPQTVITSIKAAKTTIYVGATTTVKATVDNPVGATKYTSSNTKVATVNATSGKVTAKKAGTVTIKATNNGVSKSVQIKIVKKANTLKVTGKTATAKAAKNTTIARAKAITVSKAQGTVTYTKKSGDKKITINKKTGKITVKKGLKKGKTYTVKITVKAAGNTTYNAATKAVTVKIKVN